MQLPLLRRHQNTKQLEYKKHPLHELAKTESHLIQIALLKKSVPEQLVFDLILCRKKVINFVTMQARTQLALRLHELTPLTRNNFFECLMREIGVSGLSYWRGSDEAKNEHFGLIARKLATLDMDDLTKYRDIQRSIIAAAFMGKDSLGLAGQRISRAVKGFAFKDFMAREHYGFFNCLIVFNQSLRTEKQGGVSATVKIASLGVNMLVLITKFLLPSAPYFPLEVTEKNGVLEAVSYTKEGNGYLVLLAGKTKSEQKQEENYTGRLEAQPVSSSNEPVLRLREVQPLDGQVGAHTALVDCPIATSVWLMALAGVAGVFIFAALSWNIGLGALAGAAVGGAAVYMGKKYCFYSSVQNGGFQQPLRVTSAVSNRP